jgi:hypothetical protein
MAADERYDLSLNVTGVDSTIRGVQRVADVLQKLGIAGGKDSIDFAAFGKAAAIAAVVVAVVVALKKFVGAILDAARALVEFGQLQARLGSNAGTTAFLKTIGGALGVDVGGASARVRNAVGSGLGAAAGIRAGIQPGQLDLGSAVDQGQMLVKALMLVRDQFRAGDASGALATARNLDIEDLYQFVYLTNEQIKQLQSDAVTKGGIFGQETIARAVQLRFAVSRLSEQWESLKTLFLYAFIPVLEVLTSWIASIVRGLSSLPGVGGQFAGLNQALNQSTQALNQNTAELRAMNGISGGGPRTRGAIPGAFGPGGGFWLQNALHSHAVRLGALSVGVQ